MIAVISFPCHVPCLYQSCAFLYTAFAGVHGTEKLMLFSAFNFYIQCLLWEVLQGASEHDAHI
jgi:ABC-type transport system involved in cytochrome c biogenesis permease component